MNIIKQIINRVRGMPTMSTSISLSDFNSFFSTSNYSDYGTDLSEITYFTCLKVLSETVGKLSINLEDGDNNRITKHDNFDILKVRPNPYMTPYTFKTYLEFCRNHYGNAYAFSRYKGAKLDGLYPLDPRTMQILVDNTREFFDRPYYYRYCDPHNGRSYLFRPEDIIHLKGGMAQDGGLSGMCVREVLARNMQGNKASQSVLNNLYKNGMTANAVIKYVGDFNAEKKKELVKELQDFTSTSNDRFIPLPIGMDITPLDLKLTDSQFYELKQFSSLQIAAAYGIGPNQLNDYSKSSYTSAEAQNLSFYTSTLLPILTAYEEELNYKLLTKAERQNNYGYRFNVAAILRGDVKTQMEVITGYVGAGIYRINEGRKLAGMPSIKGGDVNLINGTNVKIEDIGKAYNTPAASTSAGGKGGKNNA